MDIESEFHFSKKERAIKFIKDSEYYESEIRSMVAEAAGKHSDILVFSEYGSIELISIFQSLNLSDQLVAIQELRQFF